MEYKVEFKIVDDVLYVEGKVQSKEVHDYNGDGDAGKAREYSVSGFLCVKSFETLVVYENHAVLYFTNSNKKLSDIHYALNYATIEDVARLSKTLRDYLAIKRKKEIAKLLIRANPFFKKEELLLQVEEMDQALAEIKA